MVKFIFIKQFLLHFIPFLTHTHTHRSVVSLLCAEWKPCSQDEWWKLSPTVAGFWGKHCLRFQVPSRRPGLARCHPGLRGRGGVGGSQDRALHLQHLLQTGAQLITGKICILNEMMRTNSRRHILICRCSEVASSNNQYSSWKGLKQNNFKLWSALIFSKFMNWFYSFVYL